MSARGPSFWDSPSAWLRRRLGSVRGATTSPGEEYIKYQLAENALNAEPHRKSPIPGVGRTIWSLTEWGTSLPDEEKTKRLRLIYERESATHRIIEEKAQDIFRAGYEIEATDPIIKQIEDFIDTTSFEKRLIEGVKCALWQGNGYLERLFVEADGVTIDQAPPKTVPIGYRVIDPTRCRPVVDTDIASKTYDKVLYYLLPFGTGNKPPLKAHPDRIVHIVLTADPMAEDHLGKSEIDAIYDAALNKRVADRDLVQLIHRKAGMIYHFQVKNTNDEDLQGYQAEYGNMTNVTNLVTNEDTEIKSVGGDGAIASIQDYLRYFEDQICYGLRYPVSLFRGEGQGSISTADTNLLSYHEHIQSYQRKVEEIMEKEFDIVLGNGKISTTEGTDDYDYDIVWNPLGEKDKQRDANIRVAESQAFTNMVNGGLEPSAAMKLIGWDQDLEDMGVAFEESISKPEPPPTSLLPGSGVSPQSAKPMDKVSEPKDAKMARDVARIVIGKRGRKEDAVRVQKLKTALGLAINDLARIISNQVSEGLKPVDVKMGMKETTSRSPVDNLFLRAMLGSLRDSFNEGYLGGLEDVREVRTGRRKLLPRMASGDPKTPEDIELPKEWFAIYPEDDIKFLQEYTFRFSIERGQQFEQDLKEVLIDGLSEGKSIPEIRKDIQLKAQEMSVTEAERIARTEVIRASNEGRLKAYNREGVAKVEWVTADDERTCNICAPLDGQEMTPEEANEKFMQYGHPPINCRCTIIPIP